MKGRNQSFFTDVDVVSQVGPPCIRPEKLLRALLLQVFYTIRSERLLIEHSGKEVSLSFDGIPAKLLYVRERQINLQIAPELGAKTSTQMLVTADGRSSPLRLWA